MGAAIRAFTFVESGRSGETMKSITRWFVRRTVWPHFCAGDRLEDCERVRQIMSPSNVRLMIDHSVEERETPEDWEINLERKKTLLRRSKESLGSDVAFVPVKVTSLASPQLLEDLTNVLRAMYTDEDAFDPEIVENALSEENRGLLRSAQRNLSELCEEAKRHDGLSLALDAEQSHRQPAIDYIASQLMASCNVADDTRRGLVLYNTIQCYMIGAGRRLSRDMMMARRGGYDYGVKLVRGAYLESERARAEETGTAYPLHSTKNATDDAYDEAVRDALTEMATTSSSSSNGNRVGLLIATHNTKSVQNAIDTMEDLGLSARDGHAISFATIMGMCDNVTLALGLSGYDALKLVLFGEFDEIYPWLLRRLDENRDVLGGAHDEFRLLRSELRRRLLPGDWGEGAASESRC